MKIKIVVGLGNPGEKYKKTRHNIGFMVLDELYNEFNITEWKTRHNAMYFDYNLGFSKVIFIKPQNYINLSGDVLYKFMKYFNVSAEDIIVICDDLDLNVGSIKLKLKGSSGGHNGLKNIEQNLKTSEYKRIKIGISNDKLKNTKDYVLEKIPKDQQKIIKQAIKNATDATIIALTDSFTSAMNKYNQKSKND